jgi:nitrate/TMAO reductase-like tetraheme cytochrome c subunit
MPFAVDTWLTSSHANSWSDRKGNDYCAKCHSPFQADPTATYSTKEPVPLAEWEGVTCGACHPPHDLRVEWGTPIGAYDYASAEYTPLYDREGWAELCDTCHSGRHGGQDFQAFGVAMEKHERVVCVECHMAKVPNDVVVGDYTDRHTHDFAVRANLPYSCGTLEGGCHSNKTMEWAEKQIDKAKIHGKEKSNNGGGNN